MEGSKSWAEVSVIVSFQVFNGDDFNGLNSPVDRNGQKIVFTKEQVINQPKGVLKKSPAAQLSEEILNAKSDHTSEIKDS